MSNWRFFYNSSKDTWRYTIPETRLGVFFITDTASLELVGVFIFSFIAPHTITAKC